jgi:hypothetical protein
MNKQMEHNWLNDAQEGLIKIGSVVLLTIINWLHKYMQSDDNKTGFELANGKDIIMLGIWGAASAMGSFLHSIGQAGPGTITLWIGVGTAGLHFVKKLMEIGTLISSWSIFKRKKNK